MHSSSRSAQKLPHAPKPKIIAIVGPTASGKSDLGIFLAQKLGGEIVSADSRQVYRGMDIGTGKVTKRERQLVPHHLLDVTSPKRDFTVSQYQRLGKRVISRILKKEKVPIIVGGTGFYVDALVKNYDFPSVAPNKKLRKELERYTPSALHEMLKKLDPERATTIDPHNKRRLIRAIEIVQATGKPVGELAASPQYEVLYLGIRPPLSTLLKKIRKRLDARLRQGLIGEVRNLIRNGISKPRLHRLGLEYHWATLLIEEKVSKGEMRQFLLNAIFKFAKRQLTWFKRNKDIHWIRRKPEALTLAKNFLHK